MSGVIVITGGSRGIGEATSRLAAKRGYSVCLTYRTRAKEAAAVAASIEATGGRARALECDTTEEVAEAILWLLSDKASYVTGDVLRVAGGR